MMNTADPRRPLARHANTGRAPRGDSGLTLVEVMVAVTILVVVSVALMETIQRSLRATSHHRDYTTAIYLTKGKVEELGAWYAHEPDRYPEDNNGNYGDGFEDFRWESEVEEEMDEESWYITVTTYWGGDDIGSNENLYRLVTIVPRYKEPPDEQTLNERRDGRRNRSGTHQRRQPDRGRRR